MRYEVDPETDVAEWAREVGGKNAPEITPEEVADMASSSGITRTGLSKRIMEQIGCNKQSAYRHIRTAISKKKLRESGELMFRNSE